MLCLPQQKNNCLVFVVYVKKSLLNATFLIYNLEKKKEKYKRREEFFLVKNKQSKKCFSHKKTQNKIKAVPLRLNAKGDCFFNAKFGAPGGIRTHNLPLRRRMLYPDELQRHLFFLLGPRRTRLYIVVSVFFVNA